MGVPDELPSYLQPLLFQVNPLFMDVIEDINGNYGQMFSCISAWYYDPALLWTRELHWYNASH